MAYTKTNWLDRAVQFATRYLKTGETSSGVTLTADPGMITQAGTPVNAANLNKLEQGVFDAHTTADAALARSGGTMTGGIAFPANQGLTLAGKSGIYNSGAATIVGDVSQPTYINGNSFFFGGNEIKGLRTVGAGTSTARLQFFDAGVWKEVGNLIDKTACTPFSNPMSNSFNVTTTYQTLYSYTGKGYLDYVMVRHNINVNLTLKITVDGVIKYEGTVAAFGSGGTGWTGIINRDSIVPSIDGSGGAMTRIKISSGVGSGNTLQDYIPATSNIAVDYPYTANAFNSGKGTFCVISDAIYFTSSLLIELKGSGADNFNAIHYSGGRI